jgi:tRNA threonylcarbamoyladenosine biosynthesis protein TsaE
MIHTSHSLEETRTLAGSFVKHVSATPQQVVYGFSGDLGSGKTAFTQAVAKELGVTEHVTSPTFVIQKSYPVDKKGFPFKTLIHIDAYRIENGEELRVLGFDRLFENPENLILIEWPERVKEVLPKETPLLRFSFVSDQVRTIEFPGMMAE